MLDLFDGTDDLADLVRARHLVDQAVGLLAQAGNRCLAAARPGQAANLLARAYRLLELDDGPDSDPVRAADLLDALLTALLRAGRLTDARGLTGGVDDLDRTGLLPTRLVRLRARLAWVAVDAGHQAEAATHLASARSLLGSHPGDEGIDVDAVAARLAVRTGGDAVAAELGARVLAAALCQDLPEAACQALDVLGTLARRTSADRSADCFRRMAKLAGRHRLDHWGLVAQLQLGTDEWLAGGAVLRLEQVARAAARQGVGAIQCSATALLALDLVLRGHYPDADRLIGRCQSDADALGLAETLRALTVVRAVQAGLQGQRARLRAAVTEFHERGTDQFPLAPLTFGLAGAFSALLGEDRCAAAAYLDRAAELVPVGGPLGGQQGLKLLMDAVAGHLTASAVKVPWARWDRLFALFARAVVLGRAGRADEAMAMVTEAERAAVLYPMARHLGLRLVAEAAHRDGWGQPVDWLCEAEAHFHAAGVTAVAGAARALLRRWGAPPPRRRAGAADIPAAVRRCGVTVREYEVLRLMVSCRGNRTIAQVLHISPRTVEKHVANLRMKLGLPNRDALSERASALLDATPAAHGDTVEYEPAKNTIGRVVSS